MNGKIFKYGFYWDIDKVPNLGTLEYTHTDEFGLFHYLGALDDANFLNQLPKSVPGGSEAILSNEGNSASYVYNYSSERQRWIKL